MSAPGPERARPVRAGAEPPALRVFHCDDSPAFCVLVGHWLDGHPGLVHVGAAHDRPSALARLAELRPDCVLLDAMAAEPGGLDVADVRSAAPGCRVVVYSGHPRASAERLGAAGADLYLVKGTDETELVAALWTLAAARAAR